MLGHLKENKETYFNHLVFAWRAAFYMLVSSCFLLIHGLLPIISPPKLFNIENISRKMRKWDAYLKLRKLK